jgi:hypothetical protein
LISIAQVSIPSCQSVTNCRSSPFIALKCLLSVRLEFMMAKLSFLNVQNFCNLGGKPLHQYILYNIDWVIELQVSCMIR